VRNRRGDAGTGTPVPVIDGNYSASQVNALFAAKLEVEFSIDGENWVCEQSQQSRFYRFRNAMVGLEWSDPLPLIIGPIGEQGIQGIQGIKGDRATMQIGSVTTTAPGSQSTIENVGDEYDAVFNFSLPQGVKGDKGVESYLYTAYAENPQMVGFSLTPAKSPQVSRENRQPGAAESTDFCRFCGGNLGEIPWRRRCGFRRCSGRRSNHQRGKGESNRL